MGAGERCFAGSHRERVCVRERDIDRERESVCVCKRERERPSLLKDGARWLVAVRVVRISSGRVLMIDARAQWKLLHVSIMLVIVK